MSKAMFHSVLDRFLNGRIICMLSVLLTFTQVLPFLGVILSGVLQAFAISAVYMFIPGLLFPMIRIIGVKRSYPDGMTILQKCLYEFAPPVMLTWRRLIEAFVHPITGAAFIITTVSMWAVMVGMVPIDIAAIAIAWVLLLFIAEQIVRAMLYEPRGIVQK